MYRDEHELWGEKMFPSHVIAFNDKDQAICLKCGKYFEGEANSSCLREGLIEAAPSTSPKLIDRVLNLFKKNV